MPKLHYIASGASDAGIEVKAKLDYIFDGY